MIDMDFATAFAFVSGGMVVGIGLKLLVDLIFYVINQLLGLIIKIK